MQPDDFLEYVKIPSGKVLQIKSVPTGGTKGQVLAKSSDNDADIGWVTIPTGATPEQLEEVKFLIPDVTGFATKAELEAGLLSKQDAGSYPTVEEVYTKDQSYNRDETYSKDEVYNKEETYSKDETYTKSETIEQITKAVTEGTVDLEPYYDKLEVDALLDTKIDVSNLVYFVSYTDFSAALELKADKADTLEEYGIQDAYTKEEIDQKFIEYAPDLSGHYTKDEVDQKFVEYAPDLTEYYTKSEVDTKFEEYEPDLSVFYNKDEIDAKFTEFTPDLSGYYTKDEVYNKEEIDNQISQASTASANAVKNQNANNTGDLKFWVGTNAEYEAIPEHDNNTIYHLTDSANLEPLPNESIKNQNENRTEELKFWVGSKEEYDALTKLDEDTIYHITDDVLDIPVATLEEAGIVKPDGTTISVSADGTLTANIPDVYTKTEVNSLIPTVPQKVSEFINDAGYLTQHQDISGKADKEEVYTKQETDAKFTEFTPDLSGYYTKSELDSKFEEFNPDLSNYYTKEEVDSKISNIQSQIDSLNATIGDIKTVLDEILGA